MQEFIDKLFKLYTVPEPPQNWLPTDDDGPNWKKYRPYLSEHDMPDWKSMHWGQRKLLLTEILFFSLYGKQGTVVIYAGAAPAEHSLFLSYLFPSFKFILVDPERWNDKFHELANENRAKQRVSYFNLKHSNFPEYKAKKKAYVKTQQGTLQHVRIERHTRNTNQFIVVNINNGIVTDPDNTYLVDHKNLIPDNDNATYDEPTEIYINDKITVFHGYFTNKLAEKLGKNYKDDHVLFISDIRPTNIEGLASTLEERDKIVQENMEMQKTWFDIINYPRKENDNAWAMFKFKLTFGIPSTKYYDGSVWYQPWAPLKSPEMRLITQGIHEITYNNNWFEQHLTWFNEVLRNTPIDDAHKRYKDINNLWDTQYEWDIIELYFKHNKKISYTNQNILDLMIDISKNLQEASFKKQYDFHNGLACTQKGYVVRKSARDMWIRSLMSKMHKYTQDASKKSIKIVNEQEFEEVDLDEDIKQIQYLKDNLVSCDNTLSYNKNFSVIKNLSDFLIVKNSLSKLTQPLSLEFIKSLCIFLFNYNDIISTKAEIYIHNDKHVIVDLYNNTVDGKRQLVNSILHLCPNFGYTQSYSSNTLTEALMSLNQIYRQCSKLLGEEKDMCIYDDNKKTYIEAYQSNPNRVYSLITKITNDKCTDIQSLFEKQPTDLQILKSLQPIKSHKVESRFKFEKMKEMIPDIVKKNGIKHLDFGGGSGEFCKAFKDYNASIDTYCLDVERWYGKTHTNKYTDINYTFVNTSSIPFPDNHFDIITIIQVLHHIDDILKTLSEISRILKPGGIVFIREHDCTSKEDWICINLEHMLYDVTNSGNFESYFNYRAYYYNKNIMYQLFDKVDIYKQADFVPLKNLTKSYYAVLKKKQ